MLNELVKVDSDHSFARDLQSGAIVNMKTDDYMQYMLAKNKREEQSQEINKLKQDIANMQTMMENILTLLQKDN